MAVPDTGVKSTPPMTEKNVSEAESYKDQAQDIHEEARMVLPGVQALFGFQLIAVFNQRFDELTPAQQEAHLGALLLITLVVGLLMTPAAYHRLCEPERVSKYFLQTSSRLIASAMALLTIAIAVDTYIVAIMLRTEAPIAVGLGLAVLAILVLLWFVFPLWHRQTRERAHHEK